MSALDTIFNENQDLHAKVDLLEESLADFALRATQVDWQSLTGSDTWDLASCKQIAEILGETIQTNPLMMRGVALRHAYVYGDGFSLRNAKAGLTRKIDLLVNQQSFFNSQAQWQRINSRAYAGNLFYLVHKTFGTVIHVPISEIDSVITGDMDSSTTMFIKRKWKDAADKDTEEWFLTQWNEDTKTQKLNKDLAEGVALNKEYVLYHFAFNRPTGSAIGVPDALAAMKWAESYSEYLTNQAKLVRAYSRIAHKVGSKSPRNAQNVATAVANQQSTNTYGATAVGDITALPATGSKVDFNTGRPLAAMVASVFGVGLDSLLSGTVGASKSVSDMLDAASKQLMKVLQSDEVFVIDTIVQRGFGAKNVRVDFPAMETDPVYRQVQSMAQAHSMGWLHREEVRGAALDLFHIETALDSMPEPDGFNKYIPPASDDAVDQVPRQGHTGSVGTQIGSNKDARDNEE